MADYKTNIKLEQTFVEKFKHFTSGLYNTREEQLCKGDAFVNIDFKVDAYDNDNVALEVAQKSGTTWINELDNNTLIYYVKLARNKIYVFSMADIKKFFQTEYFQKRRSKKTIATNTDFKNFRLREIFRFVPHLTIEYDCSFMKDYIKPNSSSFESTAYLNDE